MERLVSGGLWPELRRLAALGGAKLGAVAYVTAEEFVRFGEGELLVADASDEAVRGGQTDAAVLDAAFRRGADLRCCPGLHAKVLVLGGVAVIGSANLSLASASDKVEAAWVTDRPAAVGAACAFVRELAGRSAPIGRPFLDRILGLEVTREGGHGSRKRKGLEVTPRGHRTWLVGVSELTRDYPEEAASISAGQEYAEKRRAEPASEVEWVRWTDDSLFRREAREDDHVVQIWTPAGGKRPSAVYRHARILVRQEEPACTRFYVEYPQDAGRAALGWGAFLRIAGRVGIRRRILPHTVRLLTAGQSNALFDLWGG